jgi:hypothetical protein
LRKEIPTAPLNNIQEGKTKGDNRQNDKEKGRKARLNSMSSNSAQSKGKDTQYQKGSPGKSKPMPKLSPKERDKSLAAGKCFRCKMVGHRSADCPEGEKVDVNAASTKKKKKDVTKNFAMSIEPVMRPSAG